MTDAKDRGRQAQERTRAAVGRGRLWKPGGTHNDEDGPLQKYSDYLRQQAVTWPNAGVSGNGTRGR